MSDGDIQSSAISALPDGETPFEYLSGCWKRLGAARSRMLKANYPKPDVEKMTTTLDSLKDLIISYSGLTLQDPSMFSEPPTGWVVQ